MSKTVVGLFDTLEMAQHVVKDLVDAGFQRDDISLVANDASNQYSKYLSQSGQSGTHTTEDAVTGSQGASFGAVVGALTGALVGLGALAIPGIGPVLAAGPLLSALGGGAIGAVAGAATGGVVASLVKTGIPEEEAQYYAEGVRRGGTLVLVNSVDNMAQRAADIMNRHNAVDVHERSAQWKQSGWKGYDENAKPYTNEELTKFRTASTSTMTQSTASKPQHTQTTSTREGETVLPVVEEELKVGKREVERGGVRVHTNVTETPVEENVRLREEKVNVERRPVDRPVTAADQEAFKEKTIEMKERAEEAIVSKEARVVEEVVINKEAQERNQTVRDTVRRTDVEVEHLGGQQASTATAFDNYDKVFRTHYTSTFGKSGYAYDDYLPAYRYGYTLAGDKRYSGDWNTFESDVRRSWEEQHPNTWDRFKDAIRYAWQQVTHPGTARTGR